MSLTIMPSDPVTLGGIKPFIRIEPFIIKTPRTIIRPKDVKEQKNLCDNYGGKYGKWCKKEGLAEVEISGRKVIRDVHWFEDESSGKAAAMKISKITPKGR